MKYDKEKLEKHTKELMDMFWYVNNDIVWEKQEMQENHFDKLPKDVYLDKIRPHLAIVVTTDKEQGNFKEEFLCDGRYRMNGECMLFPSKENRDWNTFKVSFKEGDIIISKYNSIHILKSSDTSYIRFSYYLDTTLTKDVVPIRFATEEEKQKLFKAIKDNGYKWNSETKTLEKLIVPKFKVGDRIMGKTSHETYIIDHITSSGYVFKNRGGVGFTFENEHLYELVPNKFDITTLKPFDKVLVRNISSFGKERWESDLFNRILPNVNVDKFSTIGNQRWVQCIPYKGNEHLLGTTNDCDEFYKNW